MNKKKKKSLLTFADKEAIAYALYDAGCQPLYSSDYANSTICGFGDGNGYFEYQLVYDEEENKVIPWELVKEAQRRMLAEEQAFNIEKGMPLFIIREDALFQFKGAYYTVSFLDNKFMMFDRENRNALFIGSFAYNTSEAWDDALVTQDVVVRKPGTMEQ